jgi:hypothetical protein
MVLVPDVWTYRGEKKHILQVEIFLRAIEFLKIEN